MGCGGGANLLPNFVFSCTTARDGARTNRRLPKFLGGLKGRGRRRVNMTEQNGKNEGEFPCTL